MSEKSPSFTGRLFPSLISGFMAMLFPLVCVISIGQITGDLVLYTGAILLISHAITFNWGYQDNEGEAKKVKSDAEWKIERLESRNADLRKCLKKIQDILISENSDPVILMHRMDRAIFMAHEVLDKEK